PAGYSAPRPAGKAGAPQRRPGDPGAPLRGFSPFPAMTGIDALWSALAHAEEAPPAELVAALERLPPPGSLPSPWVTWTLIGLARHRERQEWVAEVVQSWLGGDRDALSRGGAAAHPDGLPQYGVVPGMPEYEYFFHGCGCRLTHRATGAA